MAATNPPHIILDNVALLAGSLSAFSARYHVALNQSSFLRPGNTVAANALLHFLLCTIDGDIAIAAFKPCFPILDREQERDFRRVVDERLSALEKLKLLPVGVGRKSVVAAAGGDRFIDLAWSLTSLAVQQASFTPVYTTAARRRLTSGLAGRADSSLSQQSSARSSRTLMSVTSRDTSDRSSNKQRRFLGEGMLTAKETRRREMDIVRNRIEMEKAGLARTTQLGKTGVETWMLEAEKVREKIGQFEGKVRRLKNQLADMGFDENGNDIRGPNATAGIRTSVSREDLGQLKSSPIESMESGSSVDELLEPGETCDDIVPHFSTVISFAEHTKSTTPHVDKVISNRPQLLHIDTIHPEKSIQETDSPKNLADLVRAATDELEEATRRMDEIEQAKKKVEQAEALLTSSASPSRSDSDVNNMTLEESKGKLLQNALKTHKELHQASLKLHTMASELTEMSRTDVGKLHLSESNDSLQTIEPLATIPKPTWLEEHNVQVSEPVQMTTMKTRHSNPERFRAAANDDNSVKDPKSSSKKSKPHAPRPHSTPRSHTFTSGRRLKESTKASERKQPRHGRSNSASANPTSRSRLDSLHGTSPSYLTVKTPRSVRFAALPPSYSANRPIGAPREDPHRKVSRRVPESYATSSVVDATTNDVTSVEQHAEDAPKDVVNQSTQKSDSARKVERKDSYVRRDLMSNKPPLHRRSDSADDRSDAGSLKGVRIPRTQTPRRVVRRKEIIQRSVLDSSTSNSRRSSTQKASRPKKYERTAKDIVAATTSKTKAKGNPEKQHTHDPVIKECEKELNEGKDVLRRAGAKGFSDITVAKALVDQASLNKAVEVKSLEAAAHPPSASKDNLVENIVVELISPQEQLSVLRESEVVDKKQKEKEEDNGSVDVDAVPVSVGSTPSDTVEEANAVTLSQDSSCIPKTESAVSNEEVPSQLETDLTDVPADNDTNTQVPHEDTDDAASDQVSAVDPVMRYGDVERVDGTETDSVVVPTEETAPEAELPQATVQLSANSEQGSPPVKNPIAEEPNAVTPPKVEALPSLQTNAVADEEVVSTHEAQEHPPVQANTATATPDLTSTPEGKESSRTDIGSSIRGMTRGFTRRGNGSLRGSGSPLKSGSSRYRKKDASASNLSVHSSKDFPGTSGDQLENGYSATDRTPMLASRSGLLPQSNSQRRLRGEGKKSGSPRRPSAPASGSTGAGRGSGKSNGSPSSRRSTLKSLRARLAAVLK